MIIPITLRAEKNFCGCDEVNFVKITDENYGLEYKKNNKQEDIIVDALAYVVKDDGSEGVYLNPARYVNLPLVSEDKFFHDMIEGLITKNKYETDVKETDKNHESFIVHVIMKIGYRG